MVLLLDTDVLSELRKRRPDRSVSDWYGAMAGSTLRVSVLTLGELREGAERLRSRDPRQAAVLDGWCLQLAEVWADRLVPVDAAVAEAWGRLRAIRTLPPVDALLGATALAHGWTLVTRNVADLAGTGVSVYDPWTFGTDG